MFPSGLSTHCSTSSMKTCCSGWVDRIMHSPPALWKLITSKPLDHIVSGLTEFLPIYVQFSIKKIFKGPTYRFLELFYCLAPSSMKLLNNFLNSDHCLLHSVDCCVLHEIPLLLQQSRMCLQEKCREIIEPKLIISIFSGIRVLNGQLS